MTSSLSISNRRPNDGSYGPQGARAQRNPDPRMQYFVNGIADQAARMVINNLRREEPSLTKSFIRYIQRHPVGTANILVGIFALTELKKRGILDPVVNTLLHPISDSTLGYSVPLSPLSGTILTALSYAGYDFAKEKLKSTLKFAKHHPLITGGALYTLNNTGALNAICEMTANVAKTSFVAKGAALSLGLGVSIDYLSACYKEKTWLPKDLVPAFNAIKNPKTTIKTAANAVLKDTRKKLGETWDSTYRTAAFIYNYPKSSALIGFTASAIAGYIGMTSVAKTLFVSSCVPLGLSIAKRF